MECKHSAICHIMNATVLTMFQCWVSLTVNPTVGISPAVLNLVALPWHDKQQWIMDWIEY